MTTEACFRFFYDDVGRGMLTVSDGERSIDRWCRCGSINPLGRLINPTPTDQEYWLVQPSVATSEEAMAYVPGTGRKIAFYLRATDGTYTRTHYLFHPDGGRGGSLGCVVRPADCTEIFEILDNALKLHGPFRAEIGRIDK
jgi:hypothetical protein